LDEGGAWHLQALGAPHIGERSEQALISAFVDRIAELSPHLVTFNGSSFDLPERTHLSRLVSATVNEEA
jgi:predicted PolB exonuclease-like 3'-5' exonuclease